MVGEEINRQLTSSQPSPTRFATIGSMGWLSGRIATGQPKFGLDLPASYAERFLPFVVLLVAIFLRLHNLDTIPHGLLPDEAWNGIDALKILEGERPIYLTDNFGREVLVIYLQAVSIALLGESNLALRIVSALIGIMTVPAAYILFRNMFNVRVALLTCGWLTFSLWHVIFSRVGLRAISLPLVLALGFYCFWRGLESANAEEGAKRAWVPLSATPAAWFALGGTIVGLSLYTYSTARFAPLVILALMFYVGLLHRGLFRRAIPGLILALALSATVFLPQGLFALRHPESFMERAQEVTIANPTLNGDNLGQALLDSTLSSLGMFAIQGHRAADLNIPGRPFFDPVSALLMLLGLALVARRFRQPAYGLLIIWIVIMFVPVVLAVKGSPNFVRVSGVAPALFVLPALGAVRIWEVWEARMPVVIRALPVFLVTLAFVGGSIHTYHAYFESWAKNPHVWKNFHWERQLIIDAARRIENTEQIPIFVVSRGFDEAWLAFTLSGRSQPHEIRIFDAKRSFVFPAEQSNAGYIFPNDRPSAVFMDRHFDESLSQVIGTLPSGQPITLHRLKDLRTSFDPAFPVLARFDDRIFVDGFDMPKQVRAGAIITVRWYWRLLKNDDRALVFTNQLFSHDNHRHGHIDDQAFAPSIWPVGSTGITTFAIAVDTEAPTGAYWLHTAIYEQGRDDFSNMPVFDAQGNQAGNHLRLGPIKVHGRPPAPSSEGLLPSPPSPENPLTAAFADQIDLLGYSIISKRLVPGQSVDLTLFWSPRGRPTQDYAVFVHLLDSEGQLRGQADSPPTSGRYPTSVWDAGESIADLHALSLAPDLPAGEYRLAIGLYDPQTGKRVHILHENGDRTGDFVTISGLVVEK